MSNRAICDHNDWLDIRTYIDGDIKWCRTCGACQVPGGAGRRPSGGYLLFGFDYHYPGGGWSDFRGFFESHQLAMEAAKKMAADGVWACDAYQIVEERTGAVLATLQRPDPDNSTEHEENWMDDDV